MQCSTADAQRAPAMPSTKIIGPHATNGLARPSGRNQQWPTPVAKQVPVRSSAGEKILHDATLLADAVRVTPAYVPYSYLLRRNSARRLSVRLE
jgi:hypothetical protein